MRRRLILSTVLATTMYAAPASAASITFDSLSVGSGATFDLSVGIQDVNDLVSFSYRVLFDTTFLQLLSVADGGALGSGGGSPEPCTVGAPGGDGFPCPTAPGTVDIGNFLLGDPGVNIGSMGATLTLLTFQALQDGIAPVQLTLFSLTNSALQTIDVPESFSADVAIGDVTPVPEPSTLLLMGVGLAGLARRRFRRS